MRGKRALIYFATGNLHKVEEVKYVLKDYPLEVRPIDVKGVEIQAESVEEIAENSALQAANTSKLPIIVEDTGLFISALNGFPGPYASYIHKTLSIEGTLKLLRGVKNRGAVFRSAVAFSDSKTTLSFTGESIGIITAEARGKQVFGFDPVFEPCDGPGKTFGEMGLEEKSAISHRARAVRKFADWYVKRISI